MMIKSLLHTMAEIQLLDVSLDYSTPAREPVSRLFEIRRERNMEDLAVESKTVSTHWITSI
jgi:hypothetical protein